MAKAFGQAKKAMIKVALTKTKSIPHEVRAKFKAAQVVLRPAKGRGLVAGSALRVVLALAGAGGGCSSGLTSNTGTPL